MTTLMAMTALKGALHISPVLMTTVALALSELEDGRTPDELDITAAITRDADQGMAAIQSLASYQQLDAVVFFGKTSASIAWPDMPEAEPTMFRIRRQLSPVQCVRLPETPSVWWQESRNMLAAVEAVKPLLLPLPEPPPKVHIAWRAVDFN